MKNNLRDLYEKQGIFIADSAIKTKCNTVMMFPGHGAQYVNMLKGLYDKYEIVKHIFDKADDVYLEFENKTLSECIFAEDGRKDIELKKSTVMQPAIFTASIAMLKLVSEYGVTADFYIGHSLGELSALCAAGCFDFETGLRIVYYRAQSINNLAPQKRGCMISILSKYENGLASRLMSEIEGYCTVSIINSEKQFNISGSDEAIHNIIDRCKKFNIQYRELDVSHAFHSMMLAPIVDEYYNKLKLFDFEHPETPVFSTINNRWYVKSDFEFDNLAGILSSQLITPFDFSSIVHKINRENNVKNFLEIGPDNILTKLVKNTLENKDYRVVFNTNSRKEDDQLSFTHFIANITVNGLLTSFEGASMRDNNVGIINQTKEINKSESFVDSIKSIISLKTMYPINIIKLGESNLKISLAISDKVFKEIINAIAYKYDLHDNYIYRDEITGNEIINYLFNKSKTDHSLEVGIEAPSDEIKKHLLTIIKEKTGYPEEMLEDDLDFEADLGIDSVKQGEILAKIRELYNFELEEEKNIKDLSTIEKLTSYVSLKLGSKVKRDFQEFEVSVTRNGDEGCLVNVDAQDIRIALLRIITEKTGYPSEMLEDNLDFEADLGIDSVKQGEILSKIQEQYNISITEKDNIKDLTSINNIVSYIHSKTNHKQILTTESPERIVNSVHIEIDKKNLDNVRKTILKIVQEKTGYPSEMLEGNLDFEADLGIDSVKQGEIFAKVREEYNLSIDDNIKDLSTINKIMDYLAGILGENHVDHNSLDKIKENINVTVTDKHKASRYVAVTHELPFNGKACDEFSLLSKNAIIIQDQLDSSLTYDIVKLLNEKNTEVHIIGTHNNLKFNNYYEANFYDKSSLKSSMEEILKRVNGKIHMVINLYSLNSPFNPSDITYEEWDRMVVSNYNANFYVVKAVYNFFENCKNDCAYFAVTNIGGVFGLEASRAYNPIGAITSGFAKALEKELRPFNCKVIDIDNIKGFADLPELLIKEFSYKENLVEIAYNNNIRKTIYVLPKNISNNKELNMDDTDVIFVTGGGRGIIHECVKSLAKLCNSKIIITGRTKLPNLDLNWMKMNEKEFDDYKTVFMVESKKESPDISVMNINQKYENMKNARELVRNLENIKSTGYQIEYMQCDAVDPVSIDCVVNEVIMKYGKITGVINGAGLPSFGKIPKKPEDFSMQVLRVKANSFVALEKACSKQKLKFFISMGSISGRFGMDGQVDYSAAADLIVRLSFQKMQLNSMCRYAVIGWSAWDDVGMAASEQVKNVQQGKRGLEYISAAEGCDIFIEELLYGSDYPELLYFGKIGEANMPLGQLDMLDESLKKVMKPLDHIGNIIDRIQYPQIDNVADFKKDKSIIVRKNLSLEQDIHLQDHLVEGRHVFAGVMHLEAVCQMIQLYLELSNETEYKISEIADYKFEKFIKVFKDQPLELVMYAELVENTNSYKKFNVQIKSDFINKKGIVLEKDRLHSLGTIITYKEEIEHPEQVEIDVKDMMEKGQLINLEKYYENSFDFITFGESFKCIEQVNWINNDEIVGSIRVPNDGDYYSFVLKSDSIISPVTVDNIGRLMLLNDYHKNGYSIVPIAIGNAKKYRSFISGEIVYVYCKYICEESDKVEYSAKVFDEDKNLIFEIENMILARINKNENDHSLF